jgi:hypothetical protein
MLMSEKEARERWCPMVRYARQLEPGEIVVAFNRCEGRTDYVNNPPSSRCIASECMMWRQEDRDDLGYCGLAGKPASWE